GVPACLKRLVADRGSFRVNRDTTHEALLERERPELTEYLEGRRHHLWSDPVSSKYDHMGCAWRQSETVGIASSGCCDSKRSICSSFRSVTATSLRPSSSRCRISSSIVNAATVPGHRTSRRSRSTAADPAVITAATWRGSSTTGNSPIFVQLK